MNCPGCFPIIDDGPHFNPPAGLLSVISTVGFASSSALGAVWSLWAGPSMVSGVATIALSIIALGALAAVWSFPRRRGGMRSYAVLTSFLVVFALPVGVWATLVGA